MPKIGPFFYINDRLIYNACSISKGREQADKLDNSYPHDLLFRDYFWSGEYINFPRGRVVWDKSKKRAIVYIDPCINTDIVLNDIISTFEIKDYVVEYDDHYHCKNCVGNLFS